jgi:hypothetical protein
MQWDRHEVEILLDAEVSDELTVGEVTDTEVAFGELALPCTKLAPCARDDM